MAETKEQLHSKLDQAYRLCETCELELYQAMEHYRLARATAIAHYGEAMGLDDRHLGPQAKSLAKRHVQLGALASSLILARAALGDARQSVRTLRNQLLHRRLSQE